MDRKGYISDNLRKISSELREVAKNGVVLPVYEQDSDNASSEKASDSFSKAQENRLSDVYKAKVDILSRINRRLAIWQEEDKSAEIRNEIRRKLIAEWSAKLDELKNLEEPENLKEMTLYIRTVEHFRMDFFAAEAKIDEEIANAKGTVNNVSAVDIKQFYTQLKLLNKLLTILIIIVLSGSLLIAAAIWFSMNL